MVDNQNNNNDQADNNIDIDAHFLGEEPKMDKPKNDDTNSSSKYQSRPSEESLLGIILNNPDSITNVASYLRPKDFYYEDLRLLYSIIINLSQQSDIKSISAIEIIDEAQKQNVTDLINYDLLNKLSSFAGYSTQTDNLVRRLSNLSEIREIENSLSYIVDLLKKDETALDKDTLLSEIEKRVLEITRSGATGDFRRLAELNEEFWADFQVRKNNDTDELTGVPSNFRALDTMTNGFQKGDLIIIGARPSMGKTAFALNLTLNALSTNSRNAKAREKAAGDDELFDETQIEELIKTPISTSDKNIKTRVALFSLEMPSRQLIERFYAIKSQVPIEVLKLPNLIEKSVKRNGQQDMASLELAKEYLSKLNLFIDDSSTNTITDLAWKLRRLNKLQRLDLVVIDYLQLLTVDKAQSVGNRQNEINIISRTLKQLARELDVPIIALSQLSRELEKRENKTPILSDLRESGGIEQDADIVIFLHSDAYYSSRKKRGDRGEEADEEQTYNPNKIDKMDVIIAKHRNGPTGKISLSFMRSTNTFQGYSAGTGANITSDDNDEF
ncbi:Replicative DNA helicase [Mycoplasmopsis californica]|uniref:Replicative DNA helicase n=1 Tax=Mycoplasmopsis equigenitalium TaxID=114883 RepID=A0ABY5J0Q6_9BACT|nr:replicative DNA helicase [Mycoplasmopsis equigenitalium]UUD36841.1 replicative DNA helicase [Mycoplasmopsis equigenitalium]VEU69863.1 Replicative DNA helicase [Mycoplasmopsis californica]